MRLLILLFILLITAVGYFALLNSENIVELYLTQDSAVKAPLTALILLAMASGGLLVILAAGFRELRALFLEWRSSRLKKREIKVHELYTEAIKDLLGRRHRQAISLFQKVLAINPNHMETLIRLGNLYRQEKNFSEAIRLHKKARGLEEQNLEVLFALARDCEEANRFEEATSTLRDILKLDGVNLTAQRKVRDLAIRSENWEEAHEMQEKILKGEMDPEEAKKERDLMVGIKYEKGRDFLKKGLWDKAKRCFRSILRIDKNFLPAYAGLGEALIQEGKITPAADLWEKAFSITGNLILLHKLEDLYLENGEPEKAIGVYQKALEKDPTDEVFRFYLGKLYYRLEMIDDACDVLAGIDASDERFPDLHKLRGNLFVRKGDHLSAVEEFKKALDLKKRVVVPYYCPFCDYHTIEWSGRCPRCEKWNTYSAVPIIIQKSPRTAPIKTPL